MSWGRPREKPGLLGAVAEEPEWSRRAPERSVTPWAWAGGGAVVAKLQLAGNRGWFPVWKGMGPAEGSGGSAARHTPAFLPPSPPFCWKSKVIVNPGWGGLDEGPKLEEVALGVGPR